MKIALVSPYDFSYPGGINTHICYLAGCFREMGHGVRILAPCSRPGPDLPEELIPLGHTCIPIPSGGSWARITLSPRLLYQVKGVLGEERFDIVHVHDPLTPALAPVVLSQAQVPLVGTFHAYHSRSRGYALSKPILRRWFQHLNARIAVSQPALEFVRRYFPGDYHLIPNGVDTRRFSPEVPPLEQFADGRKNILFVGRLEKRKGLEYLLEAYRVVKAQLPGVRLLVVGPGGGPGGGYQALAQGMEGVVFCGYVPNAQLPRYYATADFLCAPATGEESFGIVLVEAMASGKPVVASAIPGFSQVVHSGQEGLLVPPRDPQALAQALLYLLQNPQVGQEMGERGRQRAREYDWRSIAGRVMEIYRGLLGGPG